MKGSIKHCVLKCVLGMGLLGVMAAASAQIKPLTLSSEKRAELEVLLAGEVERTLQDIKPLEGQIYPAKVTVMFDTKGGIIVDLGRDFIPREMKGVSASFRDQLHLIWTNFHTIIDDDVSIRGFNFLYGGKDLYYYFPEDAPQPIDGLSRRFNSSIHPGPPNIWNPELPYPPILVMRDKIAINPGHGLYKAYGSGTLNPNYDWMMQRSPYYGVLEDEMTLVLAKELGQVFHDRNWGVDTFYTRSTSNDMHQQSSTESGVMHRWADMAAKYYIEQQYPERTDLWDVTKDDGPDRDRAKDINSRALYANEMGAAAMISLHTNAGSATATGTEIFYRTGSAEGEAFANSAECYMKEVITSQRGYEGWRFRGVKYSSSYAENSGEMPSILVEVGFHENPSDALALQDPVFRTAAMKGVEKGYRLRDQPCESLSVLSVHDADIPNGTSLDIPIEFKGHPTYPVYIMPKIIKCPIGVICTNRKRTVESGPLIFNFSCSARSEASVVLSTTITDADGVTSEPVDSIVVCKDSFENSALQQREGEGGDVSMKSL